MSKIAAVSHRCRECGGVRRTFNNRKATRGRALYDLVMAWRFDRGSTVGDGAQTALCRMAASFKADNDNNRAVRRFWDGVSRVKARNGELSATVAAVNVAGCRRTGGFK